MSPTSQTEFFAVRRHPSDGGAPAQASHEEALAVATALASTYYVTYYVMGVLDAVAPPLAGSTEAAIRAAREKLKRLADLPPGLELDEGFEAIGAAIRQATDETRQALEALEAQLDAKPVIPF